jgi:hypothetical protein
MRGSAAGRAQPQGRGNNWQPAASRTHICTHNHPPPHVRPAPVQMEFTQIHPKEGWCEHDPEEILQTVQVGGTPPPVYRIDRD